MAGAGQRLHMLLREVSQPSYVYHGYRTLNTDLQSRDSGVNAIESLMERRGAFDYILLETTGLADPGNIAPLFWVDEGLGSTIYLDGIVTLVDAKNILKSLDEPPVNSSASHEAGHHGPELTTAHLQISHADVIVINKGDLVDSTELDAVRRRIESINALAKIHITSHSQVPQLEGVLLDLHAYDTVQADELDFTAKGHSHLDTVCRSSFLVLKTYHFWIVRMSCRANMFSIDYFHYYAVTTDIEFTTARRIRRLAPLRAMGLCSTLSIAISC